MEIADQYVELRAGPLVMLLEPGGLRYVRLAGREVLRRIYVGVRDRNWGTIEPQISNLKLEIQADSFRIEFDSKHQQGEIDFRWHGEITGTASGEISFAMRGEAHNDFMRNRIGFCVLHPIDECAGQPCEVLHTDGTIEQSRFPLEIAPHQPWLEMRALTHEVLPGLRATVVLEGETFEAEDQRNWTDASFKIYSTPLALPFPVLMKKGERVSQRITLQLTGTLPNPEPRISAQPSAIRLRIGEKPVQRLPRIGLGLASHEQALTARQIARLRELRLSHLRVDLDLSQDGFEQRLERAVAESIALDAGLEVAIFLSDAADAEWPKLMAELQRLRPRVIRWLIFHAQEKVPKAALVNTAVRMLWQYDADAVIGAGTNMWFTEINRCHPPVAEADLVCYAISPQTHAIDDLTLMENLIGQAATVQNAKRLFGNLPVAVTPVTLKPRFGAAAADELPPQVDVRQPSLQAAAWTLGSIKYLAESGADSITYFETTGWRGVMELESGSLLPLQFNSLPDAVFPLWHVLAGIGEFAGGQALPVQLLTPAEDALKVIGLALRRGGQRQVMLANLTAKEQHLQLELPSDRARVKRLNQGNLQLAMQTPEQFRTTPANEMFATDGQLSLTFAPYELITLLFEIAVFF